MISGRRTGRSSGAWAALCAIVLLGVPAAALAQERSGLDDFATATGKCDPSQMEPLLAAKGGETFTVAPAVIYQGSGLSPAETDVTLPAMTPLRCHRRDGKKVLVSSDQDGSCGWVDDDNLLQSKADPSAEKGILSGSDLVCETVKPMSMAEFCEASEKVAKGQVPRECKISWVKSSPFEAKLLLWNAGASAGKEAFESIEVPTYRTANADEQFQNVKIFNVLRVFDIKPSKSGVRYLIGASHRRMEGWVESTAGTIWYSKLATFFARDAKSPVLQEEPGAGEPRPIAEKPPNIAAMLDGTSEFRRYPVLVDNRESKQTDPATKRPHLQVAFIGAFCQDGGKGALCSAVDRNPNAPQLDILQKADILFLIDATKSMQPYFGLVARAVKSVAADSYTGNADYQFGAALYGDHKITGEVGLDQPIDFYTPIPLGTLYDGTEFDNLEREPLFIEDKQKDLPEAMYAGIVRAIKETPWRGDEPRFIIHIADHGDRDVPRQQLLDLLKENRIFYIPVPVRGSYDAVNNANFVAQSQSILDQHRTPNGLPIGVEVPPTYNGSSPVAPSQEYNAIAQALKAAVDKGKALREQVLNEILARKVEEGVAGGGSQYPPGYAKMLDAFRELYNIKIEAAGSKSMPVAARGFVETAAVGQPETNWDYFAEIRPQNVRDLQRSFESLCGNIKATEDSKTALEDAISKVVEILTGDVFKDKAELESYFSQRDKIPLSKLTILGPGIMELGRDLSGTTASAQARVQVYQREVCRTSTLLSLMQSSQRLAKPADGGDLVWDDKKEIYSYKNAQPFDWQYKDDFGESSVFLPLTFMPRAPEDVVQPKAQ